MLLLCAIYRGDNVVCSKGSDCTFIRSELQHYSDDDEIQYYRESNKLRVLSNVADNSIVSTVKFKPVVWVNDRPSIRRCAKFEHEGLVSAQFAIVIQDRLWCIKHSPSKSDIYISIANARTAHIAPPYEGIIHPSHTNTRIICVDVNRCILYIYFDSDKFIMVDMTTRTLLPTVLELPMQACTPLKSFTVDREGNFWALYETNVDTYKLRVYNPGAKLIDEYELTGLHVSRNNCGKLKQWRPKIERIIHHPTQNKLFIMYDKNFISMLSTVRWTPHMYNNLPYALRSAILCFVMIVWFPPFDIPRELTFAIIADLMDMTTTIDFTGNDKRRWITDARARIKIHS